MIDFGNSPPVWAMTGGIPNRVLTFEGVPPLTGWLVVLGLLLAVCALLALATQPWRRRPRRRVVRRPGFGAPTLRHT